MMTENMPNNMVNIDGDLVNEVVVGAMALLVEGESCEATGGHVFATDDVIMAVYCDELQQSVVIMRCSLPLASSLTGKMLEMDIGSITEVDIMDATGELVNVIAGNLRGLIERPGKMSAPFLLDEESMSKMPVTSLNSYSVSGESMLLLRL